jgi:hypothetical protein
MIPFTLHPPGIGYELNCSPYPFRASLAHRIQQMKKGRVKPTTAACSVMIICVGNIFHSHNDATIYKQRMISSLLVPSSRPRHDSVFPFSGFFSDFPVDLCSTIAKDRIIYRSEDTSYPCFSRKLLMYNMISSLLGSSLSSHGSECPSMIPDSNALVRKSTSYQ